MSHTTASIWSRHGAPCWYELGTTDLDGAQRFYAQALGWSIAPSGMPGMDYRLAQASGVMAAGLMSNVGQAGNPPPNWVIYFLADNVDATSRHVIEHSGQVLVAPADIPGVGRFAVLADPQGAVFGILQPAPMPPGQAEPPSAFAPEGLGRCNWNELMTVNPAAAGAFYGTLFGWTKSQAFDMGEMGSYQLFAHHGTDIGGMMGLAGAPVPYWLPYFGVDGVERAQGRITAAGGQVVHGPTDVPGGAFILVARDPQGAHFAVLGPK